MSSLLSFVLAGMAALAPGRDHTTLATAITNVVAEEAPLFADDADRRRTASLIVAVSFRESSFRNDVVSKTRDYCHLQVNQRPDLAKDAEACTRVGLDMLRTSMRVCPKTPLAWYAVGGTRAKACSSPRGRRISDDRTWLAKRVFTAATEALATESSS